MGLNDYLAKNNLTYQNLKAIRNLSETIEYNAAMESVNLAKVSNVFGAFYESEWSNGNQTARFASLSSTPDKWAELQKLIDKHGIRNSQLTSPAPTTSTSIYQEASATFLPVFEKFFAEDNKNGTMAVAAKFLKEFPEGYGRDLHEFDALEIIDVASELQKFIDTGISMELMFDQNKPSFKAKDLYDAIHYAHKKKCKAIYYIRSIKKNANIEIPEVACESCAS
jgi:ribonucleoside-diphosphate reductase alpha chain